MRNLLLGLALGLGIGIIGALLVRPPAASVPQGSLTTPEHPTSEATPRPLDAPNLLAHPKGTDDAIVTRLAAVEAEVHRLADAVAALREDATGGRPSSAAEPARDRQDRVSVDSIRASWTIALDELQARLTAMGPETTNEIGLWSRWDDLRKAQRAFAAARTMEDLRKLSEGEWNYVFKWPK